MKNLRFLLGNSITPQVVVYSLTRFLKKNMENYCKSCDKSFHTKYYLIEHIKIIHDKILSHKCKQCSRIFGRKYELRDHINFVHNKMKFDCQVCKSIFQNARNLRCHIKKKHPSENLDESIITPHIREKKYQCDKCPKSFDKRSQKSVHVKSEHKSESKSFQKKSQRSHHLKTKHEGSKHSCDLCDRKFKSSTALRYHKKSKHIEVKLTKTLKKTPFDKKRATKSNPTLTCETCDLRFMSIKILQRHERICKSKSCPTNESKSLNNELHVSFQETQVQGETMSEGADDFNEPSIKLEPDVIVEIPLSESRDIDSIIKQEVNQNIPENTEVLDVHCELDIILESPPDEQRHEIDPGFDIPQDSLQSNIPSTSQAFETGNDPEIIVESVKKEKKSFLCNPCNKTFETELDLGVHIGMTHSVTFMKCPKCSSLFSNQHEFVLHVCK